MQEKKPGNKDEARSEKSLEAPTAREAPREAEGKDDHTVLDAFLDAFDRDAGYEEISFDAWQSTHASLDLHMDLGITAEEAAAGGHRELPYTIQHLVRDAEGHVMERRKLRRTQVVRWAPGCRDETLAFAKCGDRDGSKHGTLLVRLRVGPV